MGGSMNWATLGRFSARASLALLFWGIASNTAWTQQNSHQIDAKPLVNVEDKDDITKSESKVWVLNLRFDEPRLITVDIPARGRRLCWYLRYEILNQTKEPRTFIPKFELVTTDQPGHVYVDQVLPKAQEAIREQEDPLNHLTILNSQTISEKPIPVSRPGGPPKPVTGVAIWDDVPADANRFSIFVNGLSNGYSLAEIPPDNKQIVRSKTLQLNFKRVGDRFNQQTGDIKFVPPVEWVYRATGVVLPASSAAAAMSGKK
ncbi:MAG TPA: hypothetical protein VGP68_20560 [Gemmataceae bacterium]|jgi:hypothetical protein|nr:hypothetical protein [Gemmataceae bacterium]